MTNMWLKNLRIKLINDFGSRCQNPYCGSTTNLEFHHRKQSGWGAGRGRNQRILDVYHHPRAYKLLCKECHKLTPDYVHHIPRRKSQKITQKQVTFVGVIAH